MCLYQVSKMKLTCKMLLHCRASAFDTVARSLFLLGGLEALRDVGPVDDLPDGLEVVGAGVLVVQVVSMLPHVDAEQRHNVAESGSGVLVRRGGDLQALKVLVVHEPAPAAALYGRSGGVEFVNEAIEVAELLVQGLETGSEV